METEKVIQPEIKKSRSSLRSALWVANELTLLAFVLHNTGRTVSPAEKIAVIGVTTCFIGYIVSIIPSSHALEELRPLPDSYPQSVKEFLMKN